MSAIFGHLNISDSDRVFSATQGQAVIWQAVQEYLERVRQAIEQGEAIFLEEVTEIFKERFKLPGGGYLQRRGPDGRYGAVKAVGYWDVAYPLEDFGAQIAGNDVDMAYMTIAELDRHLQTVAAQGMNTERFELLKCLFKSTQTVFVDPLHGSLNVEHLANGDAVVYPPVMGSDTEATESHYLESGYLASAISDTNNPYETIRDDLVHHFGARTGGLAIATLINSAQRAKTEALTDFDAIPYRYVRPGQDTDVPTGLPAGIPGQVIGTVSEQIVSCWDHIPANYMVGIYLDAPKPLKKRTDPADTGLGRGLQLVAKAEFADQFPFNESFWRDRFGYGGANRLSAVVMELGNGGSYTIPTAFS